MDKREVVKESLNIPIMILCIIGFVLAIFGFFVLKNEEFKLKVISTQGTVTGITISRNAEGEVEQRTVTLSYIANNSNYNATISNYSEEIEMGDQMTLYYDFLSPSSVDNKRSGYVGYLSVSIGLRVVVKTGPRFFRIIRDNYL